MQNLHKQNIKIAFWRGRIEPVKHLSWDFLQKRLTVYSRKQFPEKESALDV